jgi:hypothetical protein
MEHDLIIPAQLLKPHIAQIPLQILCDYLNKIPQPQLISAEKGQSGEAEIKSKIRNFVIHEHKNCYSGDFMISKPQHKIRIMVEVKNYTANVGYDQYEKFLRDLSFNQCEGGILITNKKIHNIEEPLFYQANIMVLVSYDAQLINLCCELLWNKLYEKYHAQNIDSHEIANYIEMLQCNIDNIVKIKIATKQIENNLQKNLQIITANCEKTILAMKKCINRMHNNIKVEICDLIPNPIILDKIQQITVNHEYIGLVKGIMNFHREGKYLYVKNQKTKTQIYFAPNTFNFEEHKDVCYKSGMLWFDLTDSTDIAPILKFL